MRKSTQRALIICLAALFVMISLPVSALGADKYSIEYAADASTMDAWQQYFGAENATTENAGGVWLDKSVFTDTSAFPKNTVTLSDGNALIALSALSSSKTVVGYDNTPTDTIFVLDVSLSMVNSLDGLVQAANESIKTLFELNEENRIGVILYSGYWGIGASDTDTATVLLTVDRYSASNADGDFLYYQHEEAGDADNVLDDDIRVRVADGVTNSAGETVSTKLGRDYGGSTYIQNALYKAYQTFDAVESTVVESGIQKGAKRIPVMVFMSDGAPTSATTDYANVGTSNVSNGKTESGEVADVAFITQLTASFVRGKIEEKYARDMLFYSLGGTGTNDSEYAKSILNPKGTTEALWDIYVAANGSDMYVYVPTIDKVNSDGSLNWYSPAVKTGNQYCIENQDYVDAYYLSNDVNELIANFKNIIEEINIQTKYYPTDIEGSDADNSGFIVFTDEIGNYMEVKSVQGILLGDVLFSGAMLTSQLNNSDSGLGTVENPTALGDKVIQAVRSRIGVDLETGRMLFDNAYKHGQLSYTSDTEFSNYIGWYAKADGSYSAFYADGVTEAPADAVYINRSYGFLGETGDSDMLFMYVMVQEEIATGNQTVVWKIPASLVPVVRYSVVFDGENIETSENIVLEVKEADPIRLVFEVGFDDSVDETKMAEIMGESKEHSFFTNLWEASDKNLFDDVATKAHFTPSTANERYYFAADADMYYLDDAGDYRRIDWYNESYFDPNRTFYAARNVYEATPDANDGNKAVVKTVFEPISATAFEQKQKGEDGYWYIPKGTVRLIGEELIVEKTENASDTLSYVAVPHVDDVGDSHEAGTLLGNNLRITVTENVVEPDPEEPTPEEPTPEEPTPEEPTPEEPTPEEPVVPGDASNMLVWCLAIAFCVVVFVEIPVKVTNRNKL